MDREERLARMVEALRQIEGDPNSFVVFGDADHPDNYVQLPYLGLDRDSFIEVTSRTWEDAGPDALPPLTSAQVSALAELGFHRIPDPNYSMSLLDENPDRVAEICELAFEILGSSPQFVLTVTTG